MQNQILVFVGGTKSSMSPLVSNIALTWENKNPFNEETMSLCIFNKMIRDPRVTGPIENKIYHRNCYAVQN